VVRATVAEDPPASLGIPYHLLTASTIVVGVEPVLEDDPGDGLYPLAVRVELLERAVGVTLADATGAEDLVQSHDDDWHLDGLDAREFEASAGVAAERLRREGGLDGLYLILGQYLYTFLNGLAVLCPLDPETKKGPLPGMGTALR
jgi:hypothetical protein